MTRRRPLFLRGLVLLGSIALICQSANSTEVPYLSGRVNDYAGVLSPVTITDLQKLLKAEEDSTSNQIVILTITSLEGESLEEYSYKVASTWKLGQRGKNNGVLLLVARDDRKVRIEVGTGLEGALPDITCGQIIRKEMVPRFKEGDFDGGVESGVRAIIAAAAGEYSAGEEEASSGDGESGDLLMRIVMFIFFLSIVGLFTFLGIITKGGQAWFLYVFLIPFWAAFPAAILGGFAGLSLLACYLVGFPLARTWLKKSDRGKAWSERLTPVFGGGFSSSGGWSSGSSGGGFSGGGGGFSGGGASGSW